MKGKQLLILIATAAILIIAAVYTSRDTYKKPPTRQGETIFPNLADSEINEIIIEKEDESLTIARINDIWVCRDKQDYTVKFDRIKDMVIRIADIKIGQVPTVTDALRARMGIIPPPQAGSGTLIKLKDTAGNELVSLLIGNIRQSAEESNFRGVPEGTFISVDLGETAYLVKDNFHHVTVDPNGWLETELLNIPEADIERISIQSHDGKPLVLTTVNGEMIVEGLRKREATVESTVSTLRSALTGLHFNDIAQAGLSDKKMGFDKPITYTAETLKGETYKVQIGATPGAIQERYVRLSAELKPLIPKKDADADTPDISEEEKEKALAEKVESDLTRKNLKKKIQDLNAKFSKYTYTLATYKTDNMVSTRESAVKPKPKDIKK